MTDYEKAAIFNGIATITLFVGVLAALAIGAILLPWWPAKLVCAIGLTWYACRTFAAYYVNR